LHGVIENRIKTTTEKFMNAYRMSTASLPHDRLERIAVARDAMLFERQALAPSLVPVWVERSWQRCLQKGLQPQASADFDQIAPQHARRVMDESHTLLHTARPMLAALGAAIANSGYFAILTNRDGVVVDVSGAIDRSDRRAGLITRIGTDLSEASIGTTAIGTALSERQPVWLHRGEHFFANTAVYSCAGAPLFGPDGRCVGMLDLTGIDAVERQELKHLVAQVAGKIENALVLAQNHAITVRLNWPGNAMGSDADGILCIDADGLIVGANPSARQMVSALPDDGRSLHVSEVFGAPYQMLFDAARRSHSLIDVPLWTGLRLQALPVERGQAERTHAHLDPTGSSAPMPFNTPQAGHEPVGLRDIESALIHQAVERARGNVAQAAQALGISRATVYRKLGRRPPH
jgi:transcriptional regulator of acetoin/glycerol metabolism